MIVDAHHHFWDPARREYPWMGPDLAPIRRPFGPNDLRPQLDDNGVEKTILVQTVSSLDETREFLETAAANDFIGGVLKIEDFERLVVKTVNAVFIAPNVITAAQQLL